ncbi:MAG: TatD DNase family protein [Bacteroidia bacterium]|jgi:TatD DNase family protein
MGITFVDTHSHLYADEFQSELDNVVQRATDSGVTKILLPSIDTSSFKAMNDLANAHLDIFKPMIGLHPCSVVPETYQYELEFVKTELDKGGYIAIGEIGMDLYWDKTTQAIQEEALRIQCKWAAENDLPVALHTRNATNEVIAVIKSLNLPKLTGVFHCFGDGLQEANTIIDMGFKIGLGGVLTFKNSGLDKVVKDIDIKYLVLETDAPYLAPAPYRGKTNESSYIPIIAQKLADIKEIAVEKVAEITTQNAKELFRF